MATEQKRLSDITHRIGEALGKEIGGRFNVLGNVNKEECAAALGLTGRPDNRVHNMSPGEDRSKERSRFFPSIARAMAEQWGGFALEMERIAA